MAGRLEDSGNATDDEQWRAIITRDRVADNRFVYAVKTTGIYCRPSCASRRPKRTNVRIFASGAMAAQAGFRPCRKCRPEAERSTAEERVFAACRYIEQSPEAPRLAEVAKLVGLSASHFHRLFSRTLGVTPREYATSCRSKRLRDHLERGETVTSAIYGAGFAAASRCYDSARAELGMTPATLRRGGAGQEIQWALTRCHLGWILVAATDAGICLIEFGDTAAELEASLRARFPAAVFKAGGQDFRNWVEQVIAFVQAPERGLRLPLDIQGTAFQRKVWKALQAIPAGETVTYTELAARIGQPSAVRAVASACAANRLAVAIPCHRVVRSDGSLSGYRWGVERKKQLLQQEAIAASPIPPGRNS